MVSAKRKLIRRSDQEWTRFWSSELVYLAGVVGLGLGLRLSFGPHLRDDAYITLRYASHLAHGLGFTFNTGERVLGTTTPLFTVLVALGIIAGLPAGAMAVALGIAGDAVVVVLIWWHGRAVSPTVGLVAAALYAVTSPAISYAVSGMETSVYLALILAALASAKAERLRLSAVLCGFLTLLRPDGGLVVAAIVFEAFRRSCLQPRRFRLDQLAVPAGLYLAIVIPWVLVAIRYFGTPVPQSLIAKWDLHVGYREGITLFVTYFLDVGDRWFLPLTIAAVLGLLVSRGRAIQPPLSTWTLLYGAAFLAANKFVYPAWPFEWYFLPLIPPYLLLAANGASWLLDRASTVLPKETRTNGSLLLIILVLGAFIYHDFQERFTLDRIVGGREVLYQEVGSWMMKKGILDQWIAAPEIGALGVSYPGPILDLWGLVSPSVVGMPFGESLRLKQPDWFVAWSTDVPSSLRHDPWFDDHYRPVFTLRNWESRRLIVYRWYPTPVVKSKVGPILNDDLVLLDRTVSWQRVGNRRFAHVVLTWQGRRLAPRITFSVQALGESGEVLALQDNEPQEGSRPTTTWSPGQVVVDRYDLSMRASQPPPTVLAVVGYPTGTSNERLSWKSPGGSEIGPVLSIPLAHDLAFDRACHAHFEQGITLEGSAVQSTTGGEVVSLVWSASQPIPEDYTVFVHFLDNRGRIIGQADSPPDGGKFPTSTWIAGDQIVDHHQIKRVVDSAREVLVGLYLRQTGRRLLLLGKRSDSVTLDLSHGGACKP